MPTDGPDNAQLRKVKVLEKKRRRTIMNVDIIDDRKILSSRLTSTMAAQGAGTALNVVPVVEHVIGSA